MISTHILDTSLGNPASGVKVVLEKDNKSLSSGVTNNDGRIVFDIPHEPGVYKLTFEIEEYFKKHGIDPFFMNTPIIFKITNTGRKYHVPLLLNPYGLSTYRGS